MENWQLEQLRNLPLDIKVKKTEIRIREWYEHFNGDVYVSFSGGKDSTVLLYLVRRMYPDIEAVFVDTGLEYPEIREFVKLFDNVKWLRPEKNFRNVINDYGYPIIGKKQARFVRDLQNPNENNEATRNLRLTGLNRKGVFCPSQKIPNKWLPLVDAPFKVSEQCCDIMKKGPAHKYAKESGKYPYIATMTDESALRKKSWIDNGCNMFGGKIPMSRPMSFWKENDILTYIVDNKLDLAKCYGDIIVKTEADKEKIYTTTKEKRTGCMFCMFGVHLEEHPNRFERMKETHPNQYAYCMNQLGLDQVLSYVNVEH
ncbi:MAG: phosphoadenosine phosphosulfate reductase family protein [Lachnotalea sp.]